MNKNIEVQRLQVPVAFIFLLLLSNEKNSKEEGPRVTNTQDRSTNALTNCYFSKPRKINQCQVDNCQNPKKSQANSEIMKRKKKLK
jgi:hypothetical protein